MATNKKQGMDGIPTRGDHVVAFMEGDDSPHKFTAYAKKRLADAQLARSTAAEDDDEDAYKKAQERVDWWKQHILHMERTSDSAPAHNENILNQAQSRPLGMR